jgi:hypothetical protein
MYFAVEKKKKKKKKSTIDAQHLQQDINKLAIW